MALNPSWTSAACLHSKFALYITSFLINTTMKHPATPKLNEHAPKKHIITTKEQQVRSLSIYMQKVRSLAGRRPDGVYPRVISTLAQASADSDIKTSRDWHKASRVCFTIIGNHHGCSPVCEHSQQKLARFPAPSL